MTEALTHLTKADRIGRRRRPLAPALSAEQAAYQALLKLRAREHEVTRASQQQQQQQQSGSASGPQSRAQQQLEQLELDDRRTATRPSGRRQPPAGPGQRENRRCSTGCANWPGGRTI